ncbi:MAG: LytR C-terminal domain-containing protein [Acidimicrobiales bacterium]|nr:LytR C-terminal domain-containing protein [Acidimicrobiales bacterium]
MPSNRVRSNDDFNLPENRFGGVSSVVAIRRAIVLVVAVVMGFALIGSIHDSNSVPTSANLSTTTSTTAAPTTVPPITTILTTLPVSQVVVLVANGTGVPNAAAHFTGVLKNDGYTTLPATDTLAPTTTTTIYYQSGGQGDALGLAHSLGLPASSVSPMPATPPVKTLGNAEILVALGPPFASTATSVAG